MSFDKELINQTAIAYGSAGTKLRKYPSANPIIDGQKNDIGSKSNGQFIGLLSGYFFRMNDGIWYQILLNPSGYCYCRKDVIVINKSATGVLNKESESELLVNMANNDKELYKRLIYLEYLVKKSAQKNQQITSIDESLQKVFKRYNLRQQKIKESNIVKFEEWNDSALNYFKQKLGISALPALAAPLLLFASGAVAAGLIYYAFKPDYEDSKSDLKISKDLQILLESLNPAEAQAIKNDLEKQIDDAYNAGKSDQGFLSVLKTLVIVSAVSIGLYGGYKVANKK